MIKKLKIRYLITNMSLLCGTLLIFLGVLFGFLYHAEVNSSYRVMEQMLDNVNMPQRAVDEPSPAVALLQDGAIIELDSEIAEQQPSETTPGFDPNQINPWENQWGNGWDTSQWGYMPWIYTPWIYAPWSYQWYNNGDPNNGGQNQYTWQYPTDGTNPYWGYYQQPQTDAQGQQQDSAQGQQPLPPEQDIGSQQNNWVQTPEEPSDPLPQNQNQPQPEPPDDQAQPEPAHTSPRHERDTPGIGGIGAGKYDHSIAHFTTSHTVQNRDQTRTEAAKQSETAETPFQSDAESVAPAQNPAGSNPQNDAAEPSGGNENSIPEFRYGEPDSSFVPRSVVPIEEGQYVPNALIAQTDENGNLAAFAGLSNTADGSSYNFSTASQAWDTIRKTGTAKGTMTINETFYRYISIGDYFVLLDRTPEISIINRLIMIFVLIALLGIIIMFLVSWKLANWSVSPIELAWEKQKQFVADASHELKTPLAVISANTEVIMANPDASVSGQSKWLNYIQSETMRMSKLISSLLSIARMDHPEESAETKLISLSDTVSNVCLQFEPIIYENGKTLNTVILRKVMFKAEEDNVKQLLSILLDNAVVHSVPKAQITVSLSKDTQGKIRLTVSNTAKDIPQEQLEHLFDRFYRVDTEGSPNGSGLGLSIAKSIVHQMGGKISVTSENQLVTFTAVF